MISVDLSSTVGEPRNPELTCIYVHSKESRKEDFAIVGWVHHLVGGC